MPALLDQLIEEAWMIFHREREGLPCSLRRARLAQMIQEAAASLPPVWAQAGVSTSTTNRTPRSDYALLAANDDTFRD